VVRALEHAAAHDGIVRPGDGVATQTIGPSSHLRVVDAILSGTHEPGTSHHRLLGAFAEEQTLRRMEHELERTNYRTHEFGDWVFIENARKLGRGNDQLTAASTSTPVGQSPLSLDPPAGSQQEATYCVEDRYCCI
jgi:S-adenosylmethionine:tRNA ribosyltransferase-isomerase